METGGINWAEILEAIGSLAWPVIAVFVVWRFYPHLRQVIESRAFTIKIGGMEISAQDATSNLLKQINDLQDKVEELRRRPLPSQEDLSGLAIGGAGTSAGGAGGGGDDPGPPPEDGIATEPEDLSGRLSIFNRILWVDDHPENNVSEMARLRELGHEVHEARTTDDAMAILDSLDWEVDFVITDMGRMVGRSFRRDAGLDLIRKIEGRVRTIVYSGYDTVRKHVDRMYEAGAFAATSSTIELYEILGVRPAPSQLGPRDRGKRPS